jgi:hypothetical protein
MYNLFSQRTTKNISQIYSIHLARRRVRAIRRNNTIGIVRLTLHILPLRLDGGQHRPSIMHKRDIRDGLRRVFLAVHDARVRRVVVVRARVRADSVAGLFPDEGVYVRAHVPAAEGGEAPVGFYSGDLGVCCVLCISFWTCHVNGHTYSGCNSLRPRSPLAFLAPRHPARRPRPCSRCCMSHSRRTSTAGACSS